MHLTLHFQVFFLIFAPLDKIPPALSSSTDFAKSISYCGDINQDGYSDIVAGAPGTDLNGTAQGAVYVLFLAGDRSVKSYTEIPSSQLYSTPPNNFLFGHSLDCGSDLNGDGVPELAVTAFGISPTVHILFLGPNGNLISFMKIGSASGSDYVLSETNSDLLSKFFGSSVSIRGDVDLNGVPDIVVGGLSGTLDIFYLGKTFVLSGSFLKKLLFSGLADELLTVTRRSQLTQADLGLSGSINFAYSLSLANGLDGPIFILNGYLMLVRSGDPKAVALVGAPGANGNIGDVIMIFLNTTGAVLSYNSVSANNNAE